MFCPECKSEYRAGWTQCSDCNIPLVNCTPQSENVADLVCLRSFATDGELFLAKSVLESAGIDAMVSPPTESVQFSRSFGVGLPATDLYVRAGDFVIANEILARAPVDSESNGP